MPRDYHSGRAFGKPENIEKRLAMWKRQLSTDKGFPWVGLGLIDDLDCACRMLGGDPDKQYPDIRAVPAYGAAKVPEPVEEETEYDL